MLRKFMMVSALVFIFPGEPAQIGIGLLIVFAFLVLHLLLEPYATVDLNNMQTVSQASLLLTLFVGLMLVIDKFMQKELDLAASGAWGLVDFGQASLLQLNRMIFSYVGTGFHPLLAPCLLDTCSSCLLARLQMFSPTVIAYVVRALAGVNIFTMIAPPLLMARKMYMGLGTRRQTIDKIKEKVQTTLESIRGTLDYARS